MIEPPQIVQTTSQPSAVIHINVSWDDIKTVMGPTISEVYAAIAAQGIAPAGPWFTHHFRRPTDTFDLEVSVPVAKPIAASGRVQPGEWPAMRVVRTVFQGGYESLGSAWGEFMDWIEAQGLKTADDLWECYLVGPESGDDSAAYRTQFAKSDLRIRTQVDARERVAPTARVEILSGNSNWQIPKASSISAFNPA